MAQLCGPLNGAMPNNQPFTASRWDEFDSTEQQKINGILGDAKFSTGARAQYLFRNCPGLRFSTRAKLLYLLIAGFKLDNKGNVTIPAKVLAKWVGASRRTVSSLVRELCRTGPIPLLLEQPGRPGRASQFTFVVRPFTVAHNNERAGKDNRRHRQPDATQAQIAAFKAREAGEIDEAEETRRNRETSKRRDWMTADHQVQRRAASR